MGDFVVTDALLFLDALISGMILGVVYDVLIIYRLVIRHHIIIINIEDFIFWNLAGIYLFAVMFSANNGVVRGFFLLGAIIGAWIYKKSLSELIVKSVSNGINYLVNILLKKPVNKIIMLISKRKEKTNGKKTSKEKSRRNEGKHKQKAV